MWPESALAFDNRRTAGPPFSDWSVDQRYASRQHFTDEFVEKHRKGAEEIRNLVLQARQEGMI
jgi:hypothetical protein